MIVAGAFSALTCGVASASEGDIECQAEDARAQARERSASVAAPPPTMVRPPESARVLAAAPTPSIAPRRRNGKTIPDAELIGPRGTL
jgi:hypothetical protein